MNCGDIPLHRPEKIGLFSMVGTSNQSDPGMAIDMRPGSSPKIVITSQLLFKKTARTRRREPWNHCPEVQKPVIAGHDHKKHRKKHVSTKPQGNNACRNQSEEKNTLGISWLVQASNAKLLSA